MSTITKIFLKNKQVKNSSTVIENSKFKNIPTFMSEAIKNDIYENGLYQLGLEQGKLLIDEKSQLKAIEGKYNGFEKYLLEAKRKSVKKASIEIEIINKEVEKLEIDLNEFIEESEISTLKKHINDVDRQIKHYDENLYDDSFLIESSKIAKEEIEAEKNNIKLHIKEYNTIREIITNEINSIKVLINDISNPNITSTERNNIITELGIIIRDKYPLTLNKLKEIQEIVEDVLNIKGKQIEFSFKYLNNIISQLKPKVYRRSQIILYYLMSFLILTGEFYLIFNFTADVLMPNGKLVNGQSYLGSINFTVISFCIALPLAIGMIVKLYLKDYPLHKRSAILRKWILLPLGLLTIVGLFAIGIPNSIQIFQNFAGLNNNFDSDGIDKVFGLPTKDAIFYAIMLFSPILTLLLSIVGAILFLNAIEMHNVYANTKRRSLLALNFQVKWLNIDIKTYKSSLEKKRYDLANKITNLKNNYKEKNMELVEAKANFEHQPDSSFYIGMLNTYKNTAKNNFISGYKIGQAETTKNWSELEILMFKAKKKIINNK